MNRNEGVVARIAIDRGRAVTNTGKNTLQAQKDRVLDFKVQS